MSSQLTPSSPLSLPSPSLPSSHSILSHLRSLQSRLTLSFSLDVRSLALYRILLGFVLLLDLWDRSRNLSVFYVDSPSSFYPRDYVSAKEWDNRWIPSIYMTVGSEFSVTLVMFCHGFAYILLILGWRTQCVSVLCWYLLISIQQVCENPSLPLSDAHL